MFNGLNGYVILPTGTRFDLIVHECDGSWNYGRFDSEREAEIYLFQAQYALEFPDQSQEVH